LKDKETKQQAPITALAADVLADVMYFGVERREFLSIRLTQACQVRLPVVKHVIGCCNGR
jgi:hypothetical protein